MEAAVSPQTVLWLAFAVAFFFGAIARKTNFCTMGAIADIVNMGDWNRMRMWLLAISVAIFGSAALQAAGLIDLDKSIYRTPTLIWLSHLVGGVTFGAGMVLASGCGAKTLIRIGGGNLKSLVVLFVMAIFAYMTLRGILGVLRINALDAVSVAMPGGQDIPSLLAAAGMNPAGASWLAVIVIGGGFALFSLSNREFRTAEYLLGGFGVGLAVVAAWYVSGHIGFIAEHPETLEESFVATNSGRMESLTFVGPPAYALELLMLWSDSSRKLSFGIATVLGVIAGAACQALIAKEFRWEGFNGLEDTASHLLGAALMGFGGVTALGCTIGQGVSGFSTLALGAIITFFAIIAGASASLKFQYWRLMRQA